MERWLGHRRLIGPIESPQEETVKGNEVVYADFSEMAIDTEYQKEALAICQEFEKFDWEALQLGESEYETQYREGSAEYEECDRESKKYLHITNQLSKIPYSSNQPFSHPQYWAAFTCQGLS